MVQSFVAGFGANWAVYLSIPLISALIGWITKIVAVQMLVRPLEFRGIPPYLGWQGVIPRSATRMSTIAIDLMMNKLISPQEIIGRIDVRELTVRLSTPLNAAIADTVAELMVKYLPDLWNGMPESSRQLAIKRAHAEIPTVLERVMAEVADNVEEVFDLRAMATQALIRDKELLVRLVKRVGHKELRFIVRSGLLFGFLLGLVQMLTWALTRSESLMPIFGAFTGLVTDWLALQMIFRPVRSRRYLGLITWQGLFHKRRAEVTADYCELVTTEILTPANMIEAILTGPRAEQLVTMVTRQIDLIVDSNAGPALEAMLDVDDYAQMKRDILAGVLGHIHGGVDVFDAYVSDSLDLRSLLAEKMALLTDEEYEGLLRPAFKQDEWKLVAIGAILGFVIGELQVHLLLQ